MPRQKKPLYIHPSKRGDDFDHENGLAGIDRHIYDPFADLPDDGCPYTTLTKNAKFNGLEVLFPLGKHKLYPSCSKIIPKIFDSRILPPSQGGAKWTKLPDWVKAYYFDELRKQFYMPNKLQRETWKVFNTYGCKLYASKLWEMSQKGVKPESIHDDEWAEWIHFWKTDPDFLAQSAQNKANRNKEKTDTEGSSRVFCGSRSTAIAAVEAELEDHPKLLWEIFNQCKCRKDGEYPDDRAKKIAADYLAGLSALGDHPTPEDLDQHFLTVNPPDHHGFVYGLGSHSSRLHFLLPESESSSCGTSAARPRSSQIQSMQEQLSQATQREEALARRQQELEAEATESRLRQQDMEAKFRRMQEYMMELARHNGLPPPADM